MKNVFLHAESLASEFQTRMTTGHVLLSLVIRKGPASDILQELGFNENKVRGYLLEGNIESSNAISKLVQNAEEFAATIKPLGNSEIYLLGAALKMKNSVISDVFNKADIDFQVAFTKIMQRLTTHRPAHKKKVSQPGGIDYQQALPLPEALSGFSAKRSGTFSAMDLSTTTTEPPTFKVDQGKRVWRMLSIGSEIEQKQRHKRASETGFLFPDLKTTTSTAHDLNSKTKSTSKIRAVSDIDVTLDPNHFPILSEIGHNLATAALENTFDDIVPRPAVMEQIAEVLHKKRANCPCIVGPSGVGKTSLIEKLAETSVKGSDQDLRGKIIMEIRTSALLSGTGTRGSLAERISKIEKETLSSNGKIILFFDEFSALLTSNDGLEAVQELKTVLGKGKIQCIVSATQEEYVKYIESDLTFSRRFTKIELPEPNEQEAHLMLQVAARSYGFHHKVEYDQESLLTAIRLSMRYLHGSAMPDKAIALLDTAGARVRRRGDATVTLYDIANAAAEQIGISPERLTASDHERLLKVEEALGESVIGHTHVLQAIGETLRRNAAGFRSGRPIGSFLFLGPTGVGKTETAKTLGEYLFPDKGAFIRFDMSEFGEGHAAARLVGAPPGYLGHEEGGQLTEAVRRRPYSLVLFDEIEKAHIDVLQLLLQILDDGRLTDGMGRTVSFENTIVIMTSNLGSNLRKYKRHVGFGASRNIEEVKDISSDVLSTVQASLPPELWNRMDELLVFEPLQKQEVTAIAELMLKRAGRQLLKENNIVFEIDNKLPECLAESGGFDPEFGARPMRRTVQRLVEGPIAKLILEGKATNGDVIFGYVENGIPQFEAMKKTADS